MDARCVILDSAVQAAAITDEEIGVALDWQVAVDTFMGPVQRETFEARGALAYRPGHSAGEVAGRSIAHSLDAARKGRAGELGFAGSFECRAISD